jgi:hypothetical protein
MMHSDTLKTVIMCDPTVHGWYTLGCNLFIHAPLTQISRSNSDNCLACGWNNREAR